MKDDPAFPQVNKDRDFPLGVVVLYRPCNIAIRSSGELGMMLTQIEEMRRNRPVPIRRVQLLFDSTTAPRPSAW
jgi:hypothetical protein